jgi:hypothetical protein
MTRAEMNAQDEDAAPTTFARAGGIAAALVLGRTRMR